MIRFVCTCGDVMEVPAELAGDALQCPNCKRLVDVPALSDVDAFDADGTVKLFTPDAAPSSLSEKMRVFSHTQDLRGSVASYAHQHDADADADDALSGPRPPTRVAPRYDPETGERVTEIELAPPDPALRVLPANPADIPVAKQAVNYATAVTPVADNTYDFTAPPLRWWSAPLRIVSGTSLLTMFFVFAAHVLIHWMLLIPFLNIMLALLALLIALALTAHYCNVMQDVGPDGRDQLPVLLRNVSFSEDFVAPLFNLCVACLLCFGPLLILLMTMGHEWTRGHPWIWMTLFAIGTAFFPAAIFTAVCSGATENMLPHRVASVITASPNRYMLVLAAFVSASAAYFTAIAGIGWTSLNIITSAMSPNAMSNFVLRTIGLYLVFMLAIYLMHLSAVWMGLMYRTHYAQFNWVLQRHEPVNRGKNATASQMSASHTRRVARNEDRVQRLAAVRAADAKRKIESDATIAQISTSSDTNRGFPMH